MIIYIPDVVASLQLFSSAFGFSVRFLHESATYGELETGEIALAFAANELAAANFNTGHIPAHSSPKPPGIEVGLVTADVPAAHARALKVGTTEISTPSTKPWGQTVSCIRYPTGSW